MQPGLHRVRVRVGVGVGVGVGVRVGKARPCFPGSAGDTGRAFKTGIATAATNEMMQLQFNVAGGCPGVRPCASPVPEPEPDPSPKALTLTPTLRLTLATHPDHGP